MAVISYIPAIHEGYIRFFEQYPQDLYVLDRSISSIVPRLDRDIRALDPNRVVAALSSIGVSQSVTLLTHDNLSLVQHTEDCIVMPDESANRTFVDHYLKGQKEVQFVQAFLRWDMQASFDKVPLTDETVELTASMEYLLELARTEAQNSPDWWRQIGAAVLTSSGDVITSHNTHFPSPDYSLNTFGDPRANFDAGEHIEVSTAIHAEARLISKAAKSGYRLEGSSMIVTTFPCPNCAKLIAEAGITEVLYETGYSLLDAQDTLKAFGVTIKRITVSQHES